jgi:hypothetical protein
LAYGGTSQGAINVGGYVITPSGLTSGNYSISYVDGQLTIDPALLTVTTNNNSKTYGDTLNFTGSEYNISSGSLFVTDSISGVTLNSAGAVDTANVGTYAITPSNAVFSMGDPNNYSITYLGGQLTVDQATLMIQANNVGKVLATTDPLLTYTVQGLKFSDTASSTLSGELSRVAGEDAGDYSILQNNIAVTDSNYSSAFLYQPGSFTINPATLIVTVNNQIKVFGETDPLLDYMTSGFVLGDTAASVLSGTLSRDPGESAGLYAVNQGTLASNANYNLSYTTGSLQIVPLVLPASPAPHVPVIEQNHEQIALAQSIPHHIIETRYIRPPSFEIDRSGINIIDGGIRMPDEGEEQ